MFLLIPRWGYAGAAWHGVAATAATIITAAACLALLGYGPHAALLLRRTLRALPFFAVAGAAGVAARLAMSAHVDSGLVKSGSDGAHNWRGGAGCRSDIRQT